MAGGVSNRTYKIIVITPLLATELKATLNDNANNDFFGCRNLALLMLCNVTLHMDLLFFTVEIYVA